VWESERWGISRGPFTPLIERLGERPQLRSADLVACVSDEVADAVVERLGVPADRIMITPNTVDVDRFTRSDTTELRRQLGLDGSVVVGWIGSFRPFHALDVLIESFALASRKAPALRLLLVGSGAVLADARADVERRGLSDRVTFVGAVPNALAADYISIFDIAVLPAMDGPFHYSPLKLREFAAAGSAIIAADVGNVSSTLKDGEEALIVGAGTPGALADAMVTLAHDPERRHQLGSAAKQAALSRFDMQKVLELVEQRLSSLVTP
jgi:glycosyltransferase involved in cell wall biosynthesis